jgi:hypothetical protein
MEPSREDKRSRIDLRESEDKRSRVDLREKKKASKNYERTRITDCGTKQNAGQQLQGSSEHRCDHAAEWGESKAPLMHPAERWNDHMGTRSRVGNEHTIIVSYLS